MPHPFFTWRQAILQSGLPSTTRHVLLTLSCHMNDAGESCYPSISLLSRETGLDRTTIMLHLKSAKEAGWIKTIKHGFADRKWARNEYMIAWPEAVGETDHHNNEVVGLTAGGGRIDRVKAVGETDPSTSYNSSYNSSKKRGRFTPPSPQEVQAYCKERNNTVDPNQFVDFYASKGWKVGNTPMRDWKAAVRTWERRAANGKTSHTLSAVERVERANRERAAARKGGAKETIIDAEAKHVDEC